MSDQPWDPIAAEYAELHDGRLDTVFPHALERLRERGAKRVLDYGGGPGIFIERWLDAGGAAAAYYDVSGEMRALAARRFAARGQTVKQVEDTRAWADGTFDAVTFHAVWMCLPTREACRTTLTEIARLLKPAGCLLVSVTHPCFRDREFSTFRPMLHPDDYLNEGAKFSVVMQDRGRSVTFEDYHWSLGESVRQLVEAGFRIERMHEYADTPATLSPQRYPWLMFEAVKA